MAISLVSKMFGSGLPAGPGLQVDRRSSSNAANVYVPPPPPRSGKGYYPPPPPPPFFGTWKNPIGMGVKKKKTKGKGILLGKNSPFNNIPVLGTIL